MQHRSLFDVLGEGQRHLGPRTVIPAHQSVTTPATRTNSRCHITSRGWLSSRCCRCTRMGKMCAWGGNWIASIPVNVNSGPVSVSARAPPPPHLLTLIFYSFNISRISMYPWFAAVSQYESYNQYEKRTRERIEQNQTARQASLTATGDRTNRIKLSARFDRGCHVF